MNKKKTITILSISLVLSIAILIGITLAFLIKNTESRANIFTFGNAEIDLTEEKWDKLKPEDKVLYPNKEITKDPKVKNTGETPIYIYIEVQVPYVQVRTVEQEILSNPEVHKLFSYTVNDGWEMIESSTNSEETIITEVYAYTAKILKPDEITNTLFDNVKYLNILEGELKAGTQIDMLIKAYAIQSEYLNEQGETIKDKICSAYEKYKAEVANR